MGKILSHNTEHNHNHTTTNNMARLLPYPPGPLPPPSAIYHQFWHYVPPLHIVGDMGYVWFVFFSSGGLFGAIKGNPSKIKERDVARVFDGCH
jgi:hypothetical protein